MSTIEHKGLGMGHGGLVIGVMLVAVGLTMLATMVSVSVPQWYLVTGEAVRHELAQPAGRTAQNTSIDTSVPDAATVLRGREWPVEEESPTF